MKTSERESHAIDLEDILGSIRNYQKGINENSNNCQAIIDMKSPSNVREIQQLTGCLAALFHFLSSERDKTFHSVFHIKENEIFEWKSVCEAAFSILKAFQASLPTLKKPDSMFSFISSLSIAK